LPAGLKSIDHEPAVVLGNDVLTGTGRCGSATLQIWAFGLSPVTASCRLSGPNVTEWVMLGNPAIGAPTGTGVGPVVQSRTTRSSPPLASRLPSGL